MKTYTLYTVRFNSKYAEMFNDPYATFTTFDYNPRMLDVISTEQVPVMFEFMSTYQGESDYEYYDPRYAEQRRVHFRHAPVEWREDFEREINGQLNHVWMMGGDPLPDEVFEVFAKLHPQAINGRA